MLSRIEKNKTTRKKIDREEKHEKRMATFLKVFKICSNVFLCIAAILIYIFFIANNTIIVREYSPAYTTLPQSFHGFKIAHFSDLYYTNYTINLDEVINDINKTKPDLVIFSGGLVHKDYKLTKQDNEKLQKAFSKIKSTTGKYYVIGKNDNEDTIDILNKAGFKLLNDEEELIYFNGTTPILLRGINEKFDIDYGDNKELFKINVVHESDKTDEILNSNTPEVIISGNSRGGQIRLPYLRGFIRFNGSKKYTEEHYNLDKTDLYVSYGIGTDNIPVRLFNHPSINLYRLRKANS